MTIPAFTPDLDGILCIGGIVPQSGTSWSTLLAPDGSGNIISVDPNGIVTYSQPNDIGPYQQFAVQSSGQTGSIMPARSGGPLPGARWRNYGLLIVPTTGL